MSTFPLREKSRANDVLLDLSFTLARAINADPNTCYNNVVDAFQQMPSVRKSGRLVEGWYVVDLGEEVVLNEHCWIELLDGKLLDPTVLLLVPPTRPVFYFTGVSRSWEEIQAILRDPDAFFPYVRCSGEYGTDGLLHPIYKAAQEAALHTATTLAHTARSPKRLTLLQAQDPEQVAGIGIDMILLERKPQVEDEHGEA